MRAAVLESNGPPEHILLKEVPEPVLERPTEVRVAVKAASINPIDWKIRSGAQRGAIRLTLPWILGLDVAGHVLEVGSKVTRFKPGDAVLGCPNIRHRGSYAEQCVLDESLLALKPESLSFEEAAGLPLVGLTAWQCLLPRLRERPGQRVLVQAGSGGVGHIAIQLAKQYGAWVATTCSEHNRAFVEQLGADQVVDYKTQHWWEVVPDLDLILEALGGAELERAMKHIKPDGRVASIMSGLPENTEAHGPTLGALRTAFGIASLWVRGRLRGIDAVTVVKQTHTDQLEALVELAAQGVVKVHIDRTFPLAEAAAAHAYGETGRIRGKVVLVP